MGNSRFERCTFRGGLLAVWLAHQVEFVDCTFSGEIRKSVFFGAPLEGMAAAAARERNEIRGNDFTAAKFTDVGFRFGVDLHAQRLPASSDYFVLDDAARHLDALEDLVDNTWEGEAKDTAKRHIATFRLDVRQGQESLFIRLDSKYPELAALTRDLRRLAT